VLQCAATYCLICSEIVILYHCTSDKLWPIPYIHSSALYRAADKCPGTCNTTGTKVLPRLPFFKHFFFTLKLSKLLLSDTFTQLKIHQNAFAVGAVAEPRLQMFQNPSHLGRETYPHHPYQLWRLSSWHVWCLDLVLRCAAPVLVIKSRHLCIHQLQRCLLCGNM